MNPQQKKAAFEQALKDRNAEKAIELLGDKMPREFAERFVKLLVTAPDGVGVSIDQKFFR